MGILVDIITPVFGLVVMGYVAARLRWFEEAGIKGLSGFVFNFAIPVMLILTKFIISKLNISKFQNFEIQYFKIQICKFSNCTARLPF